MIATVDALCDRVRRAIGATTEGPVFTLKNDIDPGTTALKLNEDLVGVGTGSVLAIDAELFYVVGIEAAISGVTVISGYHGTTETPHFTGTIAEISPRFSKAVLLDAVEAELREWEPTLFREVTTTITTSPSSSVYDLTGAGDTGCYRLLRAHGRKQGSTRFSRFAAELIPAAETSEFPSSFAVQFDVAMPSTTVRVTYGAPFELTTPLTLLSDLINDVGVDETWMSALEAGVAHRAILADLAARSDWRAQGFHRDAEESTVIDLMRTADMLRSTRDRRVSTAAMRLNDRWAMHFT